MSTPIIDTTGCREPRERARDVRLGSFARGAFLLAFATSLASGCTIIFPPDTCADLDEVCPELQCDSFKVNSDGCPMCECQSPDPAPSVCWDDGDCSSGQRCDSDNYCETPPGCTDDQPCPDVCYGRCVDAPRGCSSDADCSPDEVCQLGGARPAPTPDNDQPDADPPEGGLCDPSSPECNPGPMPEPAPPPPAEEGVCVPSGCAERDIAFPECPPGTEPVFDFAEDDCGAPRCVPVDECRHLDPETCQLVGGCRLEEVPAPCDCEAPAPGDEQGRVAPCTCPSDLVCVPDDECRGLSPDECFANPNCEGFFSGGGGGSTCSVTCDANGNCVEECDGGQADVACVERCDETGECFVECTDPPTEPPTEEFFCLPRTQLPGCFSDFDCAPGQVCQRDVICSGTCFEDPSGQVICEDRCEEISFCAEASGCEQLPPELCASDPSCELIFPNDGGAAPCFCDPAAGGCECPAPPPAEPICVPRQPPSGCNADFDCGPGFRCELVEICDTGCVAPDPGDGSGAPPPDCTSSCTVEGQCVPDTTGAVCSSDAECGPNESCDMVNFCELPPDCVDGQDCPAVCFGRCVERPAPGDGCWSDADCGEGLICNTWDFCNAPPPDCPDCLVACQGMCVDPNAGTEGLCLADVDCAAGQRCATELELCAHPPGGDPNVCYSICVDQEPQAPAGVCLEDADCLADERCATESDICHCLDEQVCDVCYSLCVPRDPDGTSAP